MLEYPSDVKLTETMELLINGVESKYDYLGRKIKVEALKINIPEMIILDDLAAEEAKTTKIVNEIEKILK